LFSAIKSLKFIKNRKNIAHPDLDMINGQLSVLLWDKYKKEGNTLAYNILLAYNTEDTIPLSYLA
jgi:uncharacterized protein YprB with RNaseH-like and TPR domain